MPSLAASRESLQAFDQALFDACALLRPPEKLSIAEWADKYGFLSPEGSSKPGKWYTSNAEYQREPMEVLSPGSGFETVVLMWSSQVGKTQIALWFSAYHMEHEPGPILFMEPDEGLAKMVALERINPMIRDCPRLTPLFGKRGAKGAGNDTFAKRYPGGQLNLVWASSPLSLAGRPLPYVVSDEQSAYLAGATKEGSPSKIVKARMATYPRVRRHLKISSPRLKRTCETTADFELSDQRHFYVSCPDCGHEQILTFDRLRYVRASAEEGNYAIADCWYECEACEYHITEVDKYSMIRQGKWRAHKPGAGDGKTAGFHLSALYSPLGYTWAELAGEYLACEGLNERLQPFYNTKLGLPWDEQAEGADMGEIQKHVEDYEAQAPASVIMVTCGADVQGNRIEATKWGWGLLEQSWMIEHRIFHGDPLQSDVWKDFESWRAEPVEHELGITLPTVCTFVDSGDGNRQYAVLQYTKAHEHLGVRACKGASQRSAPIVSEARRVGRNKALQVLVGSSAIKDVLYGRFKIYDKSRPGAVHFPRHESSGASPQYFKHLTAEVLVTHQTRDGEESRWENPHKRNESLDTAGYSFGAKEFTRANLKELHRKMLAKVERMRELGRLLQVSAPERVAMVAAALQSSPSSVSSPASASPAKRTGRPRPKHRRIRLPGSAWVRG